MSLVDRDGLRERGITFSASTLRDMERHGRFPKRIRLSRSRVAWLSVEIDKYIEDRAAERDAHA